MSVASPGAAQSSPPARAGELSAKTLGVLAVVGLVVAFSPTRAPTAR